MNEFDLQILAMKQMGKKIFVSEEVAEDIWGDGEIPSCCLVAREPRADR